MVEITYRSVKGANLTPDEVDANFRALAESFDALVATLPAGVGIANVTQTGASLYVWLDDGSYRGPFSLPSATPLIGITTIADPLYVVTLEDRGRYLRCTAEEGCTVSFPYNDILAIPVGTEYFFVQRGGPINFEAPTDMTLNGVDGYLLGTDRRGAMAMVKKVDLDEWDLYGMLAEDVSA